MRNAHREQAFVDKMKHQVTYNALLEAHIEALPKDPEIMELMRQ